MIISIPQLSLVVFPPEASVMPACAGDEEMSGWCGSVSEM